MTGQHQELFVEIAASLQLLGSCFQECQFGRPQSSDGDVSLVRQQVVRLDRQRYFLPAMTHSLQHFGSAKAVALVCLPAAAVASTTAAPLPHDTLCS